MQQSQWTHATEPQWATVSRMLSKVTLYIPGAAMTVNNAAHVSLHTSTDNPQAISYG